MAEPATPGNRSQVLASWGLAGLTAAAVIVAVARVGGPAEARLDREDDRRMEDIAELREAVACEVQRTGSIPETLDVVGGDCTWRNVDRRDPATGEPYAYEPRADGWSVCATLADPGNASLGRFRSVTPGSDGRVCAEGAPQPLPRADVTLEPVVVVPP